MAYGNVYIFNLYVESMTAFNLNQQGSAGTIAAPVKTTTPPYAPQQLVVARTNLTFDQLNSPLFVNGDNQISVNYGGEVWKGTVNIPGPPSPSLQADLWLYIAYQQAFLFDTTGTMIPQQSGGTIAEVSGQGSGGGGIRLTRVSEGSESSVGGSSEGGSGGSSEGGSSASGSSGGGGSEGGEGGSSGGSSSGEGGSEASSSSGGGGSQEQSSS